MVDNIPTPEEMEQARQACGVQTPIPILMGWVLQQRRDKLAEDFVDVVQRMSRSDNDKS